MADIIAQLEVLSKESGCLIDISAIVDLSLCPKIDIITQQPTQVEQDDETICVTPSGHREDSREDSREDHRNCGRPSCYEVPEPVCHFNTVALDLHILVILGLLTEDELQQYLQTMGEMGEDEELEEENDTVQMSPLLSLDVGGDDGLLNLDLGGGGGGDGDNGDGLLTVNVGGDNGLLNLDLGGEGGLLTLNVGGSRRARRSDRLADVDVGGQRDEDQATIDVDVLTHARRYGRRADRLADVDVGGQRDEDQAEIDVDVLTHPRRFARRADRLLDIDVGGKQDEDQATIDIDLLTHPRRFSRRANSPGLLDIGVGGQSNPDQSTIDIDLLQTDPEDDNEGNGGNGGNNGGNGGNNGGNGGNNGGNGGNNGGNGGNNGGNGGNNGGNGGNNGGNGGNNGGNGGNGGHGGHLSHYQPICGRGFKKEHRDQAQACHARDVNHCLAICHSASALLTVQANVQVGDVANIQLCAAIEFDQSADGDNCHYFVRPEHEPCHDEELEDNENCTAFFRN